MKLLQLFFGTNLKMYQTASETAAFLGELAQLTADLREEPVVRFVIPSFPSLPAAGAVERNGIRLGAQNMHWENAGQYTGEVSPLMLRDLGCIDLVEIGHSERRQLFGETNQQCNQKVLSALANGFTALLCVGETAAEKYYSISDETLAIQLKVGLADVSPAEIAAGRVWIAYEPVWAIGVNGKPAPPPMYRNAISACACCFGSFIPDSAAACRCFTAAASTPKMPAPTSASKMSTAFLLAAPPGTPLPLTRCSDRSMRSGRRRTVSVPVEAGRLRQKGGYGLKSAPCGKTGFPPNQSAISCFLPPIRAAPSIRYGWTGLLPILQTAAVHVVFLRLDGSRSLRQRVVVLMPSARAVSAWLP